MCSTVSPAHCLSHATCACAASHYDTCVLLTLRPSPLFTSFVPLQHHRFSFTLLFRLCPPATSHNPANSFSSRLLQYNTSLRLFKIGRQRKARHQSKGARPSHKPPRGKMGNENSSPVAEHVAPLKLTDRSLSAVARHITAGHARKIVVMTGAGLSTAAGSKSPPTPAYTHTP